MWYIATTAVVIILISALVLLRRGAGPSPATFAEIQRAVHELQRHAVHHILPNHHGQLRGLDLEAARDRTAVVAQTIRFVYTVESRDDGLIHVISSQLLRPKPERYQVECMLVVMLTLNRQLADAGLKPEGVKFDIDRSELGTHYVGMLLTPDQHARLTATLAPTA